MSVDIWGLAHQRGLAWNQPLGWVWWDEASILSHLGLHTAQQGPKTRRDKFRALPPADKLRTGQKQSALREAPYWMSGRA